VSFVFFGLRAGNGVRTIIVESPDRFARDLAVQLAEHDFLKNLGVALIPATAPDFFTEDTPTAVLVRQVLGAIAQFEKASLVAKLKAARDRKIAQGIKCGGRKTSDPPSWSPPPRRSGRSGQAEQGYTAASGGPYAAMSVRECCKGENDDPRTASPRIAGSPPSCGRSGRWKAAHPHSYRVFGSKTHPRAS
jgi:Resolvase, N terminal domain